MALKKFTDLPNKATAGATDVLALTDPADNTAKRTTVAGLASAVAANLPNASVAASKIDFSTMAAWQSWTPTYAAGGSMNFVSVTTNNAKYTQVGKTVYFQIHATGTASGTANNTITFTLPVAAVYPDNAFGGMVVNDNSEAAHAYQASSNTIVNVRRYNSANYTIGTGKQLRISGSYEVA